MDSAVKRPWYRLHWVTWVVIGLVISSLVTAIRHPGLGLHAGSSGGFISTTPYGWPADHLTVFESGSIFPRPNERPELKYRWHYRELAFNTAFCLVLVVATVHVIELWLRSPNRMQVTLASLLGVTAVAACLAGLASDTIDFSIPWVRVRSSWLINWYGMRDPLYWPLILALGCTIYSLGWLTLALLRRAYRFVRP